MKDLEAYFSGLFLTFLIAAASVGLLLASGSDPVIATCVLLLPLAVMLTATPKEPHSV